MPTDDTIQRINSILIEGFEIEASLLKPEASLGEDLGLDSLDAVDLVVAIEKEFACRISEPEARSMRKLQDIYGGVQKCVDAKV